MRLFKQRTISEAEECYSQALRYRNRRKKSFDFRLAVSHLKRAINLEPANPLFHFELARAYAAVPLLAVTRGVDCGFRLIESAGLAVAESKEALRLKPDYAEAYLVLGEAYMYLGETEKALQAFEAVLDLSGSGRLRVYAERESGQAEQGLAREPRPEEAMRHLEQAVSHRNRREHGRAEKELDKALKLAPDWPWLYDRLCRLGG
jgi:tetratricopeptide (TPR) repeat protein